MNPQTGNTDNNQNSQPNENQGLDAILDRLNKLESENIELKEKVNPENAFKKGKERYKWPRHYSFKLWGGKPVLSYVSEKQEPERDLVYKNQYGEYTENQLMNLTLLTKDWKTENQKVLVTSFNDGFNRSEKMPAEVKTDGEKAVSYTFDTKDHWKFTVDYKIIN